ncbi:MAG: ribose-phosphate diphosphokinase [Bacteroidia bacterium]
MKTINLFASNDLVELKKFAGGENHVKFLSTFSENDKVTIQTRLNSSDDVMNLCLAVDALRNMNVNHIEAFIPYIPYARQDRVMVPGEPLSIKVFAKILNSLNLNKVTVFDAHSDVSVALIENCNNIPNHQMVKHFLKELKLSDFVLVSPDLGAYKKVDKLAQKVDYKGEIATGIKVRDLATGQIIKSDVNTNNLRGKACIVIDDICDGGRTFIELATALKAKNAGDLYFIASHGIFSHNAIDRLKEAGYKNVCSSNSISEKSSDDFYKQYNVFQS